MHKIKKYPFISYVKFYIAKILDKNHLKDEV